MEKGELKKCTLMHQFIVGKKIPKLIYFSSETEISFIGSKIWLYYFFNIEMKKNQPNYEFAFSKICNNETERNAFIVSVELVFRTMNYYPVYVSSLADMIKPKIINPVYSYDDAFHQVRYGIFWDNHEKTPENELLWEKIRKNDLEFEDIFSND